MQTATFVNPLRQGLRLDRSPEPCVMVIFGATGDLTHRKLIPALYNLALEGFLPPGFSVVGFARRPKSDEQFREEMRAAVNQFSRRRPVDDSVWESFARGLFYCASTFDSPEGYTNLAALLSRVDQERNTGGNRVFYLATPPNFYPIIAQRLGLVPYTSPATGSPIHSNVRRNTGYLFAEGFKVPITWLFQH